MPKRTTDKKLLERLAKEAPEVLEATIPEALFEATVTNLLKESPVSSSEVSHFYCRKCGEYRLKTHRHHD